MTRHTALIILEGQDIDAAITRSITLIDGLIEELPFSHDPSKTELYAVGDATTLKRKVELPHGKHSDGPAATDMGEMHHIWNAESWYTPEYCPPGPADNNGASPWQWLYYNVMHNAGPTALCFLWDVHPLAETA